MLSVFIRAQNGRRNASGSSRLGTVDAVGVAAFQSERMFIMFMAAMPKFTKCYVEPATMPSIGNEAGIIVAATAGKEFCGVS